MGSALLAQWVKGPERFTVVNPSPRDLPDGVAQAHSREALGDARFDCIVAAVKPQMFDEVMPAYADHLAPGGYVMSIAAGYETARLSAIMRGACVIRTMPNLPSAIGMGVSGLYAPPSATPKQRAHAHAMMERAGIVIPVESEERIDRVTAVAGSGPGYVFEIARAYTLAAMEHGFTEAEARSMVLATMNGAIAMACAPDAPDLATLRDRVTSKGGTTAAGLKALNDEDQMTDLMRATLQACYDRAVEMR